MRVPASAASKRATVSETVPRPDQVLLPLRRNCHVPLADGAATIAIPCDAPASASLTAPGSSKLETRVPSGDVASSAIEPSVGLNVVFNSGASFVGVMDNWKVATLVCPPLPSPTLN